MSEFEGHTPGPWRWEVNPRARQISLNGGEQPFDLTVMDFVRWGMNGAKPRVLKYDGPHELLHPAETFMVEAPGRAHHSHWFQLVKHPDMDLMAAAPTLLRERDNARATVKLMREALSDSRLIISTCDDIARDLDGQSDDSEERAEYLRVIDLIDDALAKAEALS